MAPSALASVLLLAWSAGFQKLTVHTQYMTEGADAGDFNKDGILDLVNGPYWHAGPGYQTRHLYAPVAPAGREVSQGWPLGPANAPWGNHAFDFNGDGWDDIVLIERLESAVYWYENPKGGAGMWKRHLARPAIGHESRHIGDLQGDARPEFLGSSGDTLAWFEPDWSNPTAPWRSHVLGRTGYQFGHGLGLGDVDGDGRKDVLVANGWFRQPADPASRAWPFQAHEFRSATPAPRVSPALNGGSHMHAYDVDGDGLNDVITALNAHGFGLAWFKQSRQGGTITFTRQMIMGDSSELPTYGAAFSQLHSLALADLDGDGLKDIVTGKTFWAHPPEWGDPGSLSDPVLYVFKLTRSGGQARFIPQLIDSRSGVGRHILVRDLDGDGRPDIVSGNKAGLFVFTQTPGTRLAIHPVVPHPARASSQSAPRLYSSPFRPYTFLIRNSSLDLIYDLRGAAQPEF